MVGVMLGPPPNYEGDKMPKKHQSSPLEDRLAKLKDTRYNTDKTNEKYAILHDVLLSPLLADLTNQQGLVHGSQLVSTNRGTTLDPDRHYSKLLLWRMRPRTSGFWNWLACFFCPAQECLDIKFNGQLWCCQYFLPQHFMTAQQLKDEYYTQLKDAFGGKDFVIIKA